MFLARNLAFSYSPSGPSFAFPTLQATPAEPTLILGNSGTGKTTFLHLLGLLLSPQSGEIQLDGQSLMGLSASQQTQVRASNFGIIFQKPHFIASLSTLDNLLVSNFLSKNKINVQRAEQLASALGFERLLSKPIHTLSGGEQQRVGIARAFMNSPKVILADEPTSNLDDWNCERVVKLLTEQTQQIGASLVVVTHDQRLKNLFSNQLSLDATQVALP